MHIVARMADGILPQCRIVVIQQSPGRGNVMFLGKRFCFFAMHCISHKLSSDLAARFWILFGSTTNFRREMIAKVSSCGFQQNNGIFSLIYGITNHSAPSHYLYCCWHCAFKTPGPWFIQQACVVSFPFPLIKCFVIVPQDIKFPCDPVS